MQALRKLDSERQNLLRVSDILREIEGRVEPLRKQSEKAKQYLDLRQKLRHLDINMFLTETERVDRLLTGVAEKCGIAEWSASVIQKLIQKSVQCPHLFLGQFHAACHLLRNSHGLFAKLFSGRGECYDQNPLV